MTDEQAEPISLGKIGLMVADLSKTVGHIAALDSAAYGIKREALDGLETIKAMILRGIAWEATQDAQATTRKFESRGEIAIDFDGESEPMILVPLQRFAAIADAERACVKLRAEIERLEKRNNQMAATAQDGIDQRDALRKQMDLGERERDRLRVELDTRQSHLMDVIDQRDRLKAELDQTKEEVEHLRKELANAQGEREAVASELKIVRATAIERMEEVKRLLIKLERVHSERDFHKQRFEECVRHATFFEQAFITHRFGCLNDQLVFDRRWPHTALKDNGRVYGTTVPKDWKTPKHRNADEPKAESFADFVSKEREPTKTAWGDVDIVSDPDSLIGTRREVAKVLGDEIQVVRVGHHTKIVAAVFSGCVPPKETHIDGIESDRTQSIYLPRGGKLVALILRDGRPKE